MLMTVMNSSSRTSLLCSLKQEPPCSGTRTVSLLLIFYEDLSDLFLDFPMTLSLCMCVCTCAAHDSCSAAATALKCLLHKALGRVVSRTLCANMASTQALSSPDSFHVLDFISLSLNGRDLSQGHFTKLCRSVKVLADP